MLISPPSLEPSGLNDQAVGIESDFSHYITTMHAIITKARCDLNSDEKDKIIAANAPFEWRPADVAPPQGKYPKGILLFHGLYTSPFYMQDLGRYFQAQGFLVRSLLLPGHGTRPGDLLFTHHSAWERVAQFGIAQMQRDVENIYVLGTSLGGALALQQASRSSFIKAAILLTPALKPAHSYAYLAHYYSWFDWVSPRFRWYARANTGNYARYESLTFNSASQALQLMAKVTKEIRNSSLKFPIFIAATNEDEVISSQAILAFFNQTKNPKNRMLIFSNKKMNAADSRIKQLPSACPEKNILDLSHQCLAISPDNLLLGHANQTILNNGSHAKDLNIKKIYLGAITFKNWYRHRVNCLTYNPYFNLMLAEIDAFLASLH